MHKDAYIIRAKVFVMLSVLTLWAHPLACFKAVDFKAIYICNWILFIPIATLATLESIRRRYPQRRRAERLREALVKLKKPNFNTDTRSGFSLGPTTFLLKLLEPTTTFQYLLEPTFQVLQSRFWGSIVRYSSNCSTYFCTVFIYKIKYLYFVYTGIYFKSNFSLRIQ